MTKYAEGHHYKAVRIVAGPTCKQHVECWRYHLRITEQPDPLLGIISGDFLFDARSALDHMAAALVPPRRRSHSGFPIETEPIWTKVNRRYVVRDPNGRRRFKTKTTGMALGAVAVIKAVQPNNDPALAPVGGLALLSRLNNADKHRQFITYSAGLGDVEVRVTIRGQSMKIPLSQPVQGPPFISDGAEIAHFWLDRQGLLESEINVRVVGTPVIAIRVIESTRKEKWAGYMDIELLFETVVEHIRDGIFPYLEPFVWRPGV